MADEPLDFSPTHTGGSAAARPAPMQWTDRKVLVISLCTDRQFTSQVASYRCFVVGPRVLANIGPQIQDIVGQARGKDFSALFKWKLVADKSVDGELWEQFANGIIAEQTATGQIVAPAHTARTDYANNIRFAVGVSNVSGTNTEIGNLTTFAAITFAT